MSKEIAMVLTIVLTNSNNSFFGIIVIPLHFDRCETEEMK